MKESRKIDNKQGFKYVKSNKLAEGMNCRVDIIEINEEYTKIVDNFEILKLEALKLVKHMIDKDFIKTLVYYNLFFLVEIYLKNFLLKNSKLKLEDVFNFGHNIDDMIEQAQKCDLNIDFDNLLFLLKKIKDKNGNALEFKNYSDYRYNIPKRNYYIIFDYTIDEIERKQVKGVIKWIQNNV